MKNTALPSAPYLAQFFARTCVFLTRDPWTVAAWSLGGSELWRETLDWQGDTRSETAPRLVLTDHGDAWVSRDHELIRINPHRVVEVGSPIAAFACLNDGFLVALKRDDMSIARIDLSGRVAWRTKLEKPEEFGTLARTYPDMTWDMRLVRDPIVVGEGLAVVGAGDYSGGLSCRFGLHLETGRVEWRTGLAPWSYVTAVGDTWFLGQQGYGVFALRRFANDGSILDRWDSDGYVTALPSGPIHVIELENMLPSRTHASALLPGGIIKRGAHLEGFYTSRPALTADEELVFWRSGELLAIDRQLRARILAQVPSGELDYPSGMYLGADGTLAFTLGSRLWVDETDLRPS
jgi:hypothetical protein